MNNLAAPENIIAGGTLATGDYGGGRVEVAHSAASAVDRTGWKREKRDRLRKILPYEKPEQAITKRKEGHATELESGAALLPTTAEIMFLDTASQASDGERSVIIIPSPKNIDSPSENMDDDNQNNLDVLDPVDELATGLEAAVEKEEEAASIAAAAASSITEKRRQKPTYSELVERRQKGEAKDVPLIRKAMRREAQTSRNKHRQRIKKESKKNSEEGKDKEEDTPPSPKSQPSDTSAKPKSTRRDAAVTKKINDMEKRTISVPQETRPSIANDGEDVVVIPLAGMQDEILLPEPAPLHVSNSLEAQPITTDDTTTTPITIASAPKPQQVIPQIMPQNQPVPRQAIAVPVKQPDPVDLRAAVLMQEMEVLKERLRILDGEQKRQEMYQKLKDDENVTLAKKFIELEKSTSREKMAMEGTINQLRDKLTHAENELEKKRRNEDSSMEVVPATTAAVVTQSGSAIQPEQLRQILDSSNASMLTKAVKEFTTKNEVMANNMAEMIQKGFNRTYEQEKPLRSMEMAVQKMHNRTGKTEAQISTVTSAVDGVVSMLTDMTTARRNDNDAMRKAIDALKVDRAPPGDLATKGAELAKMSWNESYALESLTVFLEQLFDAYFDVTFGVRQLSESEYSHEIRDIYKALNDVNPYVTSPTLERILNESIRMQITFSDSSGKHYDTIERATTHGIPPIKAKVQAPVPRILDTTRNVDEQYSDIAYRHRLAAFISDFLNATAGARLHDARRILEETNRSNRSIALVKQMESGVIINRQNADLAKLQAALQNRVVRYINDTSDTSPTAEMIRREIFHPSFRKNIDLLAQVIDDAAILELFPLDSQLRRADFKSVIDNIKYHLDTDPISSTAIPMPGMINDISVEDGLQSIAGLVSATAMDLSSIVDEMYSRAAIEASKETLTAVAIRNLEAGPALPFDLAGYMANQSASMNEVADKFATSIEAALSSQQQKHDQLLNMIRDLGTAEREVAVPALPSAVEGYNMANQSASIHEVADKFTTSMEAALSSQQRKQDQLLDTVKNLTDAVRQQQQQQQQQQQSAAPSSSPPVGQPGTPGGAPGDPNGAGGSQQGHGGAQPSGTVANDCLMAILQRLTTNFNNKSAALVESRMNVMDSKMSLAKLSSLTKGSPADNLRELNRIFSASMIEAFRDLSTESNNLFTEFYTEAKTSCGVTDTTVLTPFHGVMVSFQTQAETLLTQEMNAFAQQLDNYSKNFHKADADKNARAIAQATAQATETAKAAAAASSSSSSSSSATGPVEPMDVDRRDAREEERKKATDDLIYTIKWATAASADVVSSTGGAATRERSITASLDGGSNVTIMGSVDVGNPSEGQKWTGEIPGKVADIYNNEQRRVDETISNVKVSFAPSATTDDNLIYVQRHGINTQSYPYYLSALSTTDTDKNGTYKIMHPEYMRPTLTAAGLGRVDTTFEKEMTQLQLLTVDLLQTLSDTASGAIMRVEREERQKRTPVPWRLNMLVFNIFHVDAAIVRQISTACYKFRQYVRKELNGAELKEGKTRSRLLESTIATLFTACRHVLRAAASAQRHNNRQQCRILKLTQDLERNAAALASRPTNCNSGRVGGGDAIRVHVCYALWKYLTRYLDSCLRRIAAIERVLDESNLAGKRIMASTHGQSLESRISTFDIKYDFNILSKLTSFQRKTISELVERGLKSWEVSIAVLAVFTHDNTLPISAENQRSTIPLSGTEKIINSRPTEEDFVHSMMKLRVLIEMTDLLTYYGQWFSSNNPASAEAIASVCRNAAGAVSVCGEDPGPLIRLIKDKATFDVAVAKTSAHTAITDVLRKNDQKLKTLTEIKSNVGMGGENAVFNATATGSGSVASTAHVYVSNPPDHLHDESTAGGGEAETLWSTSLCFPPDGDGTILEGWHKAYADDAAAVMEDVTDTSLEHNIQGYGMLIPPDNSLKYTLARDDGERKSTRRGNTIYKIRHEATLSPRGLHHHQPQQQDVKISNIGGEPSYLSVVPGVTVSVKGGESLRKATLMANALRNHSVSYTRPIFDIQTQCNVHFEAPRLTLMPQQQWTAALEPSISAMTWNVPSLRLLYQQLVYEEEEEASSDLARPLLSDDGSGVGLAITNLQECLEYGEKDSGTKTTLESSVSSNNTTPSAISTAVSAIVNKKRKSVEGDAMSEASDFAATINDMMLAPALLRRSSTAISPDISKMCGMFAKRGRPTYSKESHKRGRWWSSNNTDEKILDKATRAARRMVVLTPCILDIHPPENACLESIHEIR